ncbi:proteinrelated to glucan 1, 4-alpha-glucosidase [Purpureocillium lavendulum]|uniref:Proteinrelated to glucan 1, 4-alpha-glucosidase n=1 Tax=Purpureocillium lavendulum TaxID=1247861 RepID=A0AB34FJ78_9HYPO|nr:proteinrelated to glucan 1, 4-alpha-glucosidase [Purpureocillium lavendulum]
MEDPWGGDPWSTTVAAAADGNDNALQPAATSSAKLDLPAAPRQAHFAPESVGGSSRGSSPRRVRAPSWGRELEDEDDAWGGWNAGADSPGWGRSPGLRPAGDAAAREPSPDPWGGLPRAKIEGDSEAGRAPEERTTDLAISLGEHGARRHDESAAAQARLSESLDEHAHDIWGVADSTPAKEEPARDHARDHTDEPVEETMVPEINEPVEKTEIPDVDDEKSAMSDDGSQKDDAVSVPPESERKPSKVQELVEMYDGIANRSGSSSEALATPPREHAVRDEGGAASEVPDIQITEARDEEPGPITRETADNDAAQKEHAPEEVAEDDVQEPLSDVMEGVDQASKPQSPEALAEYHGREPLSHTIEEADRSPKPRQSSVPFPVDLSQLDRLFPATPSTSVDPEPVPDVVIGDTFAAVSERKAWYRISRFGSIRKHNTSGGYDADDDGYVRVGWAGSHVREETLRIVRRWMEEDSIGGRVVLGRRLGAGGANMFNWDSEAPPVEIGELLRGKKRAAAHGRQASAVVRGSVMSPTEPAFAWSTSLPASPIVPQPPESLPAAEKKKKSEDGPREPKQSLKRPASLQLPRPPEPIPAVPLPTSPLAQTHTAAADTIEDEEEGDEEDEWGEMVSSPTEPPGSLGASLSAAMDMNGRATPSTLDKPSAVPPDDTDKSTLLERTEIRIVGAPSRKDDPWTADDSDSDDSSTSEDEMQHTLVTTKGVASSNDLDLWASPSSAPPNGAIVTPKQAASPAEEPPSKPPPPPQPPTPTSQHSDSISAPERESSPPPPKSTTTTTTADAELVARILRDLPDLSYMLR